MKNRGTILFVCLVPGTFALGTASPGLAQTPSMMKIGLMFGLTHRPGADEGGRIECQRNSGTRYLGCQSRVETALPGWESYHSRKAPIGLIATSWLSKP